MISKVTTPVFMGVVFFVVMTPIRTPDAGRRAAYAGPAPPREKVMDAAGLRRAQLPDPSVLRSTHAETWHHE
jgi:hypothetical protein